MSSEPSKPLLRILGRLPLPALIASPVTARILWVNKRLAQMYGIEDERKLVGLSLMDFIDSRQLSGALADLARVVAGQSPPPVTYQLKRVTGEYAAGQVSSVPLMFEGQVAMLSFVTDVSERERLLQEATESEERYRLLLDTMPSGVVVVVHDAMVYVNPALVRALHLSSPADLLGKSMYEFIAEEYRGPVREARRRILLDGSSHPAAPVELLRRDGSRLLTTASSTVIRWDGDLATQTLMYDVGFKAAE